MQELVVVASNQIVLVIAINYLSGVYRIICLIIKVLPELLTRKPAFRAAAKENPCGDQ